MIKIRNAEVTDSNVLARLSGELGYTTDASSVSIRLKRLARKENHFVLVAENETEVVGFISFEHYETIYFEPGLNITGLVVAPQSRNSGVGKFLVEAAEEYAREKGLTFIRVNSGIQRTDAHAFYRSQGFDLEQEQKRFMRNLT